MRRITLAATSVLVMLVATAAPALAGSELPPPHGPDVFGDVVTPPGGTAFTGSQILPWLLVGAVLLAVGIAFLMASRRRLAESH